MTRKNPRFETSSERWLQENKCRPLNIWLEDMESRSPSTLKKYLYHLRLFCSFTELTPQELHDKREADIESGDRLQKRDIERQVKRLMAKMNRGEAPWGKGDNRDQPQAPSTCRQVSKAVTSFFKIFGDRDFSLYIQERDKPQGDSNQIPGVSANQIWEMWSLGGDARDRNRAIITFLKDSGIRISDLCALNVGDYRKTRSQPHLNEAGEKFLVFDPFRTQKCGIIAHIHIGPEAVEDMDKYLRVMRPDASDSEPMIAKMKSRGKGSRRVINVEDPRMTRSVFSGLFQRLRKVLVHNGKPVSAHSLRKFHKTNLETGIPDNWINKLQGKAKDTYSKDQDVVPDKLLKRYMANYDGLRIHAGRSTIIETSRELSKVRKEMSEMKAQIEAFQTSIVGLDNSRALRVMALLFPDTPPEEMSARLAEAMKRIEEQEKISLKIEKREP